MSRNTEGFTRAAFELANNGLIPEFEEFIERYSESIDMYKVIRRYLLENTEDCHLYSVLECFVKHGFDIHNPDYPWLGLCLGHQHYELVKYFIQQGIPVTMRHLEHILGLTGNRYPSKVDATVEFMVDSFVSVHGQDKLQELNILSHLRESARERLLIFYNRGYDFRDSVYPVDTYHYPKKKNILTLVELGTDFSSKNWSFYLTNILNRNPTLSVSLRKRISIAKVLFSVGVTVDPNSDDITASFCNYRDTYIESRRNGLAYINKVPRREFSIDKTNTVLMYPKELLDILISNGLRISEYTVFEMNRYMSDENKDPLIGENDMFERVFDETVVGEKFIVTKNFFN